LLLCAFSLEEGVGLVKTQSKYLRGLAAGKPSFAAAFRDKPLSGGAGGLAFGSLGYASLGSEQTALMDEGSYRGGEGRCWRWVWVA
jgi:hypothetical protein